MGRGRVLDKRGETHQIFFPVVLLVCNFFFSSLVQLLLSMFFKPPRLSFQKAVPFLCYVDPSL